MFSFAKCKVYLHVCVHTCIKNIIVTIQCIKCITCTHVLQVLLKLTFPNGVSVLSLLNRKWGLALDHDNIKDSDILLSILNALSLLSRSQSILIIAIVVTFFVLWGIVIRDNILNYFSCCKIFDSNNSQSSFKN